MIKIDELQLTIGAEIPIPELQTTVHQPTIQEISFIGEENLFKYLGYFKINNKVLLNMFEQAQVTEDVLNEIKTLSNLQSLFAILNNSEDYIKEEIIEGIKIILMLLFPKYNFDFNFDDLNIMGFGIDNVLIIRDKEYDIITEIIDIIFCLKEITGEVGDNEYDPADDKAREIAEKIKKARQKINQKNIASDKNISLFSNYILILIVGLGLDVNIIKNLTTYQMFKIIKKFFNKMQFDIEIRAAMAGAKIEEGIKDWLSP